MHTVRNRKGLNPRAKSASPAPEVRPNRQELGFMLRHGAPSPPAFPLDLIVPPHRGAVITAAAWPVSMVPLATQHMPVDRATPCRKPSASAENRARKRHRPAEAAAVVVRPEVQTLAAEAPARVAEPVTARLPSPCLDTDAPIPSGRALTVRRHGFVDVLAHVLRESGRRLARWSARKRREQDMREELARANARMRALESQLEALEALRERVRQAG
jgi:hypothetical protein